jgi:hypothetical protein
VEFKGRVMAGRTFLEHLSNATSAQKAASLWGSIDNTQSFWMTRATLFNLLQDAGFTSVLETRVPYLPSQPDDHVTLAAIKGAPQEIFAVPDLNTAQPERWPEHRAYRVHPGQKWYYGLARSVGARLPAKGLLKHLFGLEWHGDRRRTASDASSDAPMA